MPWLRLVWKLGKLHLLKSHDGQVFVSWNDGHKLRIWKPIRRRRRVGG